MTVGRASFASLQAAISVGAGIVSIAGALYSAVRYVKPAPGTIDLVAVTRSDGSDRPLAGASIAVLAPDDAVVATLTTGDDGHARGPLREGQYHLHASAPHFVGQTRDVRVTAGEVADVRLQLAPEESPTAGRGRTPRQADGRTGPISRGVGAAGQFLRRFGL